MLTKLSTSRKEVAGLNNELLCEKISCSHLSKRFIAEYLGLTRQGLYNKLSGEREFKGSEIKKLSVLLKLSDSEREAIFFADYVDKKPTSNFQRTRL